jgi:hypothetical protein
MALFSIVVKQPFTLQVSKRDYPEVYWRDKRFLLTNQVITTESLAFQGGDELGKLINFLILVIPW